MYSMNERVDIIPSLDLYQASSVTIEVIYVHNPKSPPIQIIILSPHLFPIQSRCACNELGSLHLTWFYSLVSKFHLLPLLVHGS